MAFSHRRFLRNQATELVLELQASMWVENRADQTADRHVGILERAVTAVRDWLMPRVASESRVHRFLTATFGALAGYRAADEIRDRENDRQLQLALQIAGILDREQTEEAAA